MLRHKLSPMSDHPVFYDPSGKRFHRILATAVTLALLVIGNVTWTTVQQFKPIWHAQSHTDATYPEQLIAANGGSLPVIGEGDLVSVMLVSHVDNRTVLID